MMQFLVSGSVVLIGTGCGELQDQGCFCFVQIDKGGGDEVSVQELAPRFPDEGRELVKTTNKPRQYGPQLRSCLCQKQR